MTTDLPVLMYHGIPSKAEYVHDDLNVPLAQFRSQLRTLVDDGWELLGLTEALATKAADPERPVLALTFDDAYEDFVGAASVMAQLGARSTLYVPTGRVGDEGCLGWDQLEALTAAGIEIGSHSHHHRPMDTLSDDELTEELELSRAILTGRLDASVRSFCYPHGYSSRRVRKAVAAAGYSNACVIGRRLAGPHDDRFALPRLQPVPGLSAEQLRRMVAQGETGASPVLKRALQPAWRLARLASVRLLDRELT
jgi:peptidoglycan/xylan/chitin deacetylase (PgdA/CDA1 family)